MPHLLRCRSRGRTLSSGLSWYLDISRSLSVSAPLPQSTHWLLHNVFSVETEALTHPHLTGNRRYKHQLSDLESRISSTNNPCLSPGKINQSDFIFSFPGDSVLYREVLCQLFITCYRSFLVWAHFVNPSSKLRVKTRQMMTGWSGPVEQWSSGAVDMPGEMLCRIDDQ